MRRLAVLGCAWALTGCGGAVMRLPTLDYEHPVKLDVRFEEEPIQLDVVRLSDPAKPVVAKCQQLCRLELPSGRYLLRAHGDAPSRERAINLQENTRVVVRPGSDLGFNLGVPMTVVGGGSLVGAFVLGVASSGGPARVNDPGPSAGFLVAGFGGAALLTTGIVLLVTSRTQFDVKQQEPQLPDEGAFVDAQGVGLRF